MVDGSAQLDAAEVTGGDGVMLTFMVHNSGDATGSDERALVVMQDADHAPVGGHQWVAIGHVAPGQSHECNVRLQAPDDPGDYDVYVYVDHDGHSAHGGLAQLSFSVGGGDAGGGDAGN